MYTPGVIPEELREQFGNACELVCVQIPKVYDSCLLRLCLVGDPDKANEAEGIFFDADLRLRIPCSVDGIVNARVVGLLPNSFKIIDKREVPGDPNKKIISYTYALEIKYTVVNDEGIPQPEDTLILRRSETVGPLYCPDSETIIRETPYTNYPVDEDIIKLEIIAKVLDVQIDKEECPCTDPYQDVCFAVFTVGIYNIVKCELVVQLVMPAFGFCPPPRPCEKTGDPCEIFNSQLPPAFFPPQLDDFITGPCV
jgi:hypothetical protein